MQSAINLKRAAAKNNRIIRGSHASGLGGREATSVKISPRGGAAAGSNASTFDPRKMAITP